MNKYILITITFIIFCSSFKQVSAIPPPAKQGIIRVRSGTNSPEFCIKEVFDRTGVQPFKNHYIWKGVNCSNPDKNYFQYTDGDGVRNYYYYHLFGVWDILLKSKGLGTISPIVESIPQNKDGHRINTKLVFNPIGSDKGYGIFMVEGQNYKEYNFYLRQLN